ncbi:MAG: glycosyltransferase family 4 protein [Chthoniobacterales bacterium]
MKLCLAGAKTIPFEAGMTIWFASRFGPTYQGGLAAYERLVIEGVNEKTSIPVKVICATAEIDSLPTAGDAGGLPVTVLETSWFGRLSKPLWTRFASKVLLHRPLESILHHAWRVPQLAKSNAIHYVGTGWDFFGFAMAKLAREYEARFVVTPAIHPGSWGSDRIDGRLYRQADGVICFTHQESRFLEQLGVEKRKLFVCPLPPTCRTDGDGLRFRKKTNLDCQPCAFFLGRRDEGKGYPALLQAWPLVLKKVPEAVLILAGAAGEQYRELIARIPPANILDIGVPDEITKADAIAACDVFCLPSAHESFGIVYVDAWFYGKPVVCGTAPACREFIVDGKTGLWANQVPEELAEKLAFLLQDRDARNAMGRAGKREQSQRFNYDIFLQIHFDALGLTGSEIR